MTQVLKSPNLPEVGVAEPISPARAREVAPLKKPEWLKIRPPGGENYTKIKGLLRERNLHTVCEEAHCPNVSECWSSGTATFMLGTEVCTRACRFCAVKTARRPPPLDPLEPVKVAESVSLLNLKYIVLTSVDRDDLPDGGANHFAKTIRELKVRQPDLLVEALVPDFRGTKDQVKIIVDSRLDVYAHNVETVRRLQYRVRDPRAGYLQSLETLAYAKEYASQVGHDLWTKSSLMLGLGETEEELVEAFKDMRRYGVDILTLGQYLRPSMSHLPVERYVTPEEFQQYERLAMECGFRYVAAGPMVRSSYKAAELFVESERKKKNGV